MWSINHSMKGSRMTRYDELHQEVSLYLGRVAEIERLKDGQYIVLFMSFSEVPPPKGATPEEAMENFLSWWKSRNVSEAPEADLDEVLQLKNTLDSATI